MILRFLLLLVFVPGAALFAENLKCPDGPSQIEVPSGTYSPRSGVTYVLKHFRARMVPSATKLPDCLVRITEVESGNVRTSGETLTTLMQSFRTKSISDLRVELKSNRVLLAGKMRKGIEIPFQIEGPVSAAGEFLRLTAEKVNAGALPVKGFLKIFGTELDDLLGENPGKGVTIDENTLYFRPEAFGNLRGRFASATVESGVLIVNFGPLANRRTSRNNNCRTAQAKIRASDPPGRGSVWRGAGVREVLLQPGCEFIHRPLRLCITRK
ncbi:MAG: hypothetical protein AB7O65_13495 [Candidatus Korobacteraceae bacterium]